MFEILVKKKILQTIFIACSTALRYVALSYNYSYYIFSPNISYNSIYSDKSVYLRIYTIIYDASKYCHRLNRYRVPTRGAYFPFFPFFPFSLFPFVLLSNPSILASIPCKELRVASESVSQSVSK